MGGTLVDTTKVTARRPLRFVGLDDIVADAEQLGRAGNVRTVGNWTPGQIFKHVALTMHGCIDGLEMKVPWLYRLIGRLFIKRRLLTGQMPPGFQLPADTARQIVPPPETTLDEGLQSLRQAVQRLKTDPTRVPSPFLGPLTEAEWTALHCRHAELHFSFLVPE
jgi:hypothetical protein